MARAWDFPFLQKAMRGIASSVDTTRLARKTVRRHSTGKSLSSVSSVTASGALNARFLMKEGIARYENGNFVTRRNFLLGASSNPPVTSLSYSETRSTDDKWIRVSRILDNTAVSPSLITGSRPGPENSFNLVLTETATSGLTGSRSRVSLVWNVRPYSFAISLESSGPTGNIMIHALVFASVRGIIPAETRIGFSSLEGLATNGI